MTYLKLLLVRHAQSLGNLAGCMEGQTSTGLSPRGQQQVRQLAHYLVTQAVDPPTCCYTSPLQRALETATGLVAPWPSVPCQSVAALQELHGGIFQGLTWPEAVSRYPALCQQLTSQLTYCPVPQAETPRAGRARARHWLQTCLAQHRPGEVVWVVTHGGLLLHLISIILGCDRTWSMAIGHTALFEFWVACPDEAGGSCDRFNPEFWKIQRFNQQPHLSGHSPNKS